MSRMRYLVDDVGVARDFYTDHLGFAVEMDRTPGFAAVRSGDLTLLLSGVGGPSGGAQAMPDGRRPEPGGWNRLVIDVDDLDDVAERLRAAGVAFRGEVVEGRGGRQVLVEDPSGNPVELFEPAATE